MRTPPPLALVSLLIISLTTHAQTVDVTNQAELQSAIDAGDVSITLTAPIALTSPIFIGTTSSPTISINGAGNAITGTSELFFIQSGTVTIGNTTLSGAAMGGNGGTGQNSGGGALGAGGAVFVGGTANVTVANVTFANNSATGGSSVAGINGEGAGGGGGMNGGDGGNGNGGEGGGGGNGGPGGNGSVGIANNTGGGGGGLNSPGSSSDSQLGGSGGGFAGGVGGNSTGHSALGPNSGGAGSGTFGGVGGNGTTNASTNGGGGGGVSIGGVGGNYAGGGAGMFPGGSGIIGGGGAGSNYVGGFGGPGGFGAGSGSGGLPAFPFQVNNVGGGIGGTNGISAGGGGAGLGGAIFVQQGGALTVTGNQTYSGNSVTAGTGFANGAAAGGDLFLMTGATTTFAPGAGNTVTFNDTIADDSAAGLPTGQSYTPGSAAGAAVVIGSTSSAGGTVVFQGADNYSGGTDISNGTTLQVTNSGALGSGDVSVEAGSTLELSNGSTLANNVTITGTGANNLGAIARTDASADGVSGTVTLAADATVGSTSTTNALSLGVVSLGAHTLGFTGGGSFVLPGPTTGTGGLDVTNGTVTVSSATASTYTGLTTVAANSVLVLNNATGIRAMAGNLSVSGVVNDVNSDLLANVVSSDTVLTLSGNGEFNLLVAQGEERLAGLQGTSTTTVVRTKGPGQSDVLYLENAGDYTYAGLITDNPVTGTNGSLSLDKEGTGTQVLTGANTFSGGVTVGHGVLQVGDGNTPGASLGTGDVVINQAGILTLDLAQGETFSNAIHDNSFLVLDDSPSSDYTVSSVIDGTGNVTKSGGNMVTLTNANAYSGGTFIYGGTLVVGNANALGSGPVVIVSTMTTNSTVHGLTINVGGDFTDAGVLRLAIFAPNDYDSIHLTNAGSLVHLNGSLVLAVPANVATVAGHTYNVITSSNGVQGQFSSVTTTLPSIGATVTYSNNATITLQLTQLPFATLATYSANELAVARNVDLNAQNTSSGTFNSLVTALNGLSASPSALASAFNDLSPLKFGQFTSTTAANNASFATEAKDNYLATQRNGANGTFVGGNGSIDASMLVLNDPSYDPTLAMLHSRMLAWNPGPAGAISDSRSALLGGVNMKDPKDMKAMAAPAYTDPWNFYIAGNVVLAQGFSQNDVSHFDSNTESVTLGTDYRITPNFLVGLSAGYGHTDATLDNDGSSATVDSYSPGFYASYADHGWYANLSGDYIHNAYTQSRVIGFLGQTANSAPEGNEGVANLDGGYDFHKGAWTFGPLAGVQYTHLTVDGYSESGSVADLTVNSQNADSLRSRLGGRVSFTYSRCGITFTPHLDASWQHEFLDQSRGITSQFTGAVGSFSVQTTNPSRDSALVDLGLNAEINRTVTVFGDYEVQAGQENYFGQSVQAGVKIGF